MEDAVIEVVIGMGKEYIPLKDIIEYKENGKGVTIHYSKHDEINGSGLVILDAVSLYEDFDKAYKDWKESTKE